jgi:hypothetical protein
MNADHQEKNQIVKKIIFTSHIFVKNELKLKNFHSKKKIRAWILVARLISS